MWRGIGAVLRGWLEGDFWIVPWFERVAGELVVYSSKWTTGSALFLGFGLSPYNCVKRKSQVISGTM